MQSQTFGFWRHGVRQSGQKTPQSVPVIIEAMLAKEANTSGTLFTSFKRDVVCSRLSPCSEAC
jgi:hypothetical protein